MYLPSMTKYAGVRGTAAGIICPMVQFRYICPESGANWPKSRPLLLPPDKSVVDALLSRALEHAVSAIAATKFIDDGSAELQVSPVDQLMLCLTRRLLTDGALGGTAVIQLPRAQHRSALLLAICAHLLCRYERRILPGPVIFMGLDGDVAHQLRSLTVEKRRRVGTCGWQPAFGTSAHRFGRVSSPAGYESRSCRFCPSLFQPKGWIPEPVV